jgi:hypothetical protein
VQGKAPTVARCGFVGVFGRQRQSSNYGWALDPFFALSLLAHQSSHIRLGPMAISPAELHPLKMANLLFSLNELSGGRAIAARMNDGAMAPDRESEKSLHISRNGTAAVGQFPKEVRVVALDQLIDEESPPAGGARNASAGRREACPGACAASLPYREPTFQARAPVTQRTRNSRQNRRFRLPWSRLKALLRLSPVAADT